MNVQVKFLSNEQGFDVQKLKKNTAEKEFFFLNQKLQFVFPYAFLKDVQATWEAFINFFYIFLLVILPSWIQIRIADPDLIRIRIHNTDFNQENFHLTELNR